MAGVAKNHLGLWDQAVAWCRRAIEANQNNPPAYFWLAASLAQLGRLDEARSAVKAGLAFDPNLSVQKKPWHAIPSLDNPARRNHSSGTPALRLPSMMRSCPAIHAGLSLPDARCCGGPGLLGTTRLGLGHGLYCLGCGATLMALLFAFGS
jgi:tetratricopeptide (TPR) repeat protein